MGNRRDFLKSIFPGTVAVMTPLPATAYCPPEEECAYHADKLAEAMVKIHGGRAKVMLDHKAAAAHVFITS